MQNKNLQIGLITGVLLVILVFYVYQDLSIKDDGIVATTTGQVVNLSDDLNTAGNDNLIIKEIKDDNIQNTNVLIMPNLDREIEFLENFPEEARQIMIDRINTVVQDIKDKPGSYDDWISLGLQRKIIEDYEGVELAWEYAKYLEPDRFLAWSNLGDLNAYYLSNNIKAEENYIKAIELNTHQIQTYIKIVEFYKEFLNDTEKAISILEKGIEVNPNSQELKDLLSTLN
ncbi:MAG: hypothetical protein KAS02_00185 [Candidatus Pacebacteria bacterium]|nr:hypothetical protein [Candidatus Paceibacterota bacterium]